LYYAISLIAYGVSIGILAAQSISEPMTQYMLDSHHRSVGGGTTRAGILKPKEILGAKSKKSEMSPEMLLRVLPQYENDRVEVSKIADQIEEIFGKNENIYLKRIDLLLKEEKNKEALLNLVIVGAGPTGVELAGAFAEIKEYILPKDYPKIDFSSFKISLGIYHSYFIPAPHFPTAHFIVLGITFVVVVS
jgi:ribulose 1,5-bisphosphate synthetase/thiazole synthase